MSKFEPHPEYFRQRARYEALVLRPNERDADFYNGIYDRWRHPVLTREHIPPEWRFDLDPKTNPFFMERLGVNAVFNAGALKLGEKYYLVARVEGNDRKSFFAVAESASPVEGFRFWEKPVELPDTCPEETNVYDMRLTKHADGWIYGVFCSESKDKASADLGAAVAAAGWGFALLARFAYARGRDAMKNGLVLAVCHPLATLAIAVLALFPAALGLLFPDVFFYLLPVFVLCGPGGCALGLALAVRPAFARMEEERGV